MDEALYACRFVQFAAAIAVFGALSFRRYAIADDADVASGYRAAFDVWIARLTIAGAVLALVSALAFLLCQSAAMAASPAAAIDPAALGAVLFGTRFGRVWSGHLLLAILLVSASFRRTRRWQSVILILSLLLLASLGWIGHAAMEEGAAGIAHGLNQTVHLLAAGLWLGGLAPLG
jgi:copper resistance protein D